MLTATLSAGDSQAPHDAPALERAAEEGFPIDAVAAEQEPSAIVHTAEKIAALAGSALESLAQTITEKLPHEGLVGQASQAVAESLQQGGRSLESEGLSGATASIESLVRRYPIESVVAGIAAGYLLARLLRK